MDHLLKEFDRIRPLLNTVLGKFGLVDSIVERAIERRVLQPKETTRVTPSVFLPGQLDLAKKVIEGGNLAASLAYLSGNIVTHDEVVEYVVRDAFVHPGGVELWGARQYASRARLFGLMHLPVSEIEDASYCMDAVSRERFGHWLTDACPMSLLAHDGQIPIMDVRSTWPHAMTYADAFGFIERSGLLRVRRLSVYSDLGQGTLKRARYEELRRRLAIANPPQCGGASHIYLRRGETGDSRLLNNEEALIHRLERRGFRTVDVHNLELHELQTALHNATTIISLDGSHITHIYFMAPEDAFLVTLIPDDRFVDVHKNYCDCIGMGYGFLVCCRAGRGYDVNLDDLERTLDLVP